jgi:hypothetical protein
MGPAGVLSLMGERFSCPKQPLAQESRTECSSFQSAIQGLSAGECPGCTIGGAYKDKNPLAEFFHGTPASNGA